MNTAYLDNHATTALDPRVAEAMGTAMLSHFGNPSSLHGPGRQARKAVNEARQQVAEVLGARQREVVFTSGGTEANNLAIRSAFALAGEGQSRRIITSAVEHPSVLETVATRPGVEVVKVPVDSEGQLDLAFLEAALEAPTALVSLMAANNETGVRFDVESIADLCARAGVLFHCDAVQALGKGPLPTAADLVSVSAHKIHGPKGVGALRVRKGLELPPLHAGGHQERGRRGGTENTLAIIGFGVAAQLVGMGNDTELERIRGLRDRLEAGICARIERARVNGGSAQRLPTVTNVHLPGLEGEAMVIALDMEGVAISSGSACSSGTMEPSHVLLAMGLPYAWANCSLRFSLSRFTTDEEIDFTLERLPQVAQRLQALGL